MVDASGCFASPKVQNIMPLVHHLDDYDLAAFIKVAAAYGQERYGYVVTPNVDHLIRYYDDPSFRALYADASFVLLDSRFLAYLLKATKRLSPGVCTGSDLTAQLFSSVIKPGDRIVLIGGSDEQARKLEQIYALNDLKHFNPPMGFIHSADAVETCLNFIEANSPFRYCLLAVGAPQQEKIAQMLKVRARARGLALCIGASINFLTGAESRAPVWMQKLGMEWAYRLMQDPGRLAKRYLVRGPRVFSLLRKLEFRLRPAAERS
jgi:N-acetylglucosaminyldiphosphoundecaprenol N-acetyl-beta-D-mannosaminyltransferase